MSSHGQLSHYLPTPLSNSFSNLSHPFFHENSLMYQYKRPHIEPFRSESIPPYKVRKIENLIPNATLPQDYNHGFPKVENPETYSQSFYLLPEIQAHPPRGSTVLPSIQEILPPIQEWRRELDEIQQTFSSVETSSSSSSSSISTTQVLPVRLIPQSQPSPSVLLLPVTTPKSEKILDAPLKSASEKSSPTVQPLTPITRTASQETPSSTARSDPPLKFSTTPYIPKKPTVEVKIETKRSSDSPKECGRCKTTVTPRWRRGPKGRQTLCNSCGLKFLREERQRNYDHLVAICQKHCEPIKPPPTSQD
jgi:hypothetical protein